MLFIYTVQPNWSHYTLTVNQSNELFFVVDIVRKVIILIDVYYQGHSAPGGALECIILKSVLNIVMSVNGMDNILETLFNLMHIMAFLVCIVVVYSVLVRVVRWMNEWKSVNSLKCQP